ncbi:MAG: hypothetical protein E7161_00145 [Firmicutes bacterium]|nr:hypothetical protein [Bacillota bacterium]
MQRNVMNSFGSGTCAERGYVCDIEPKFISDIRRVIDPKTGAVIEQYQQCQAFYQCKHCLRTIQVGTKITSVDEIVTFETLDQERKAAQQAEQQPTSRR